MAALAGYLAFVAGDVPVPLSVQQKSQHFESAFVTGYGQT
jgi:hypothetical protein